MRYVGRHRRPTVRQVPTVRPPRPFAPGRAPVWSTPTALYAAYGGAW